jgi:hypothetical protein
MMRPVLYGAKSKFAEPAIRFFAAISAFILVSPSQAGHAIAVAGTECYMHSSRLVGYGMVSISSFRCCQRTVTAAGVLGTKRYPNSLFST